MTMAAPRALPRGRPRRPGSGQRRARVLVGWLVPLGLAIAALQATAPVLPAPALAHPSTWPAWADGREPLTVAFGVVRVLALGAAWYGLGALVVGVAVRLVPAGGLAAAADRLTVPPLRRVVAATVGVSLSTGFLGPAAARATVAPTVVDGPGSATTPATTTTATTTATTTTTSTAVAGDAATVTMHLLAPADGRPPTASPAPSPAPAAPAGTGARTWTVQPGQCFWSIADGVLGEAWGRRPTSAEIVPYWQRLIDVNRPALADPANPDLIFPGQQFTLPEVGAR